VDLGLANQALPKADVLPAARHAARALVNRALQALALTKSLMRDAPALAAIMDRESVLFGQQLQTDEAREAFSAFAERRAPNFAPR
jgi:enoyl-CoA hydratase/carnithine racemase